MENKENNNSENISSLNKEEENKMEIMETENVENIEEEHEPLTTKVYYYVDDQKMPYSTEVPVPPSKITLEVKAEIRDEYECLKPCANGRFELFLLSDNGCGRTIQRPMDQKHHHHGFAQRQVLAPTHFQSQKNCGVRASMMVGKRPASHYIMEHSKFVEGDSSPEEENTNNQLFGESNFASSLSDGDS
uniref:DIX domain-containing protein n=1 Tax=Meloidogyne javanica TaxID=6303 RepID=A0A915MUE7_MELJA